MENRTDSLQGRPTMAEMQETIGSLRAEINEMKNSGGNVKEITALQTDLKALQDELSAAKRKSAPAANDDNEKDLPTAETPPRFRFGFWG
jgi:regulator of replication initiation timing